MRSQDLPVNRWENIFNCLNHMFKKSVYPPWHRHNFANWQPWFNMTDWVCHHILFWWTLVWQYSRASYRQVSHSVHPLHPHLFSLPSSVTMKHNLASCPLPSLFPPLPCQHHVWPARSVWQVASIMLTFSALWISASLNQTSQSSMNHLRQQPSASSWGGAKPYSHTSKSSALHAKASLENNFVSAAYLLRNPFSKLCHLKIKGGACLYSIYIVYYT